MIARKTTKTPADGKTADGKLFILMVAMFAAGLGLLAIGGYEVKGALESIRWPQTKASITASFISERTRRESDRRSRTTYFPQIRYAYQVKGQEYTGSRIEFGIGDNGGSQQWAQKVVDRYPSGKNVLVYYNPQEPGYGVLEVGFNWRSLGLVAAGGGFFAAGLLCLASYRKSRRR